MVLLKDILSAVEEQYCLKSLRYYFMLKYKLVHSLCV